jgi:hypothetical protein
LGLENEVLTSAYAYAIFGPDSQKERNKMYKGQQYEVKTGTSEGLNLRREPTTKGGKTNIILSMPSGTIVTLESVTDPDRISDGHTWYNVRYKYEDGDKNDEIGWAASDYLLGVGLGGHPREYTFKIIEKIKVVKNGKIIEQDREKKYSVTETNLESAVTAKYFSTSKLTETQTQITLDKPFQKTKTYWVSQENLKNVTIDPIT